MKQITNIAALTAFAQAMANSAPMFSSSPSWLYRRTEEEQLRRRAYARSKYDPATEDSKHRKETQK